MTGLVALRVDFSRSTKNLDPPLPSPSTLLETLKELYSGISIIIILSNIDIHFDRILRSLHRLFILIHIWVFPLFLAENFKIYRSLCSRRIKIDPTLFFHKHFKIE